jgi:hypothetical protein
MELKIGAVTALSSGEVFCIDMEADEGFETVSPDDADIWLQLDIGPKDADWAETFSIRVATPNNVSTSTKELKNLRIHSYSFQTMKSYLVTAVAACERETWEECLYALRSRFLWEWDTPNRKKSKK